MSQQERPLKGSRASPELLNLPYSAVTGSNTGIIANSFNSATSLVGFQLAFFVFVFFLKLSGLGVFMGQERSKMLLKTKKSMIKNK